MVGTAQDEYELMREEYELCGQALAEAHKELAEVKDLLRRSIEWNGYDDWERLKKETEAVLAEGGPSDG